MTMIRKMVPARLTQLGDDEVLVTMSTGVLARDGHILVPSGAQLDNYRRNPIVLWQHDPSWPVARASEISADAEAITARVTFAPIGVSKIADETRGLVKAGIVIAVSVGFDPIDAEPLDPKKPKGGQRITKWELLECSFVSVPADTGAVVTAREVRRDKEDWRVGAARDLPIEDSDEWDGPAAQKSIFAWAGGDDFEPAKARQGFLVYDAAKPKLKGSYKLPIAHAVDGELQVPKGAIRAAASRLPQTDIPKDVEAEAEEVLDHYRKKAGIGDEGRGRLRPVTRARRVGAAGSLRGLPHVANLCWLIDQMLALHSSVAVEAALEGDPTEIPGQLHDVIAALGEVLTGMTEEEVAEILATGNDEDDEVMEMAHLSAQERFRLALARARTRARAPASNGERIEEAQDHHKRALDHHARAVDHHRALGEHHAALEERHEETRGHHEAIGDALEKSRAAIGAENGAAAEALDGGMRAHRAMGRNLDAISSQDAEFRGVHDGLDDAHRNIGRHVRAARRALDAVIPDDDTDPTQVQTSDGTGASDGSENGRAYRRQVVRRHLAAIHRSDAA
jgi:HK97 family phage prohead protease